MRDFDFAKRSAIERRPRTSVASANPGPNREPAKSPKLQQGVAWLYRSSALRGTPELAYCTTVAMARQANMCRRGGNAHRRNERKPATYGTIIFPRAPVNVDSDLVVIFSSIITIVLGLPIVVALSRRISNSARSAPHAELPSDLTDRLQRIEQMGLLPSVSCEQRVLVP